MNNAATNSATESVTFSAGDVTFVLAEVGSDFYGIRTFGLGVSHTCGGSAEFELTMYRGDWSVRKSGGEDVPSEIHSCVRAIVDAFTASDYWGKQGTRERFTLAGQVAAASISDALATLEAAVAA